MEKTAREKSYNEVKSEIEKLANKLGWSLLKTCNLAGRHLRPVKKHFQY